MPIISQKIALLCGACLIIATSALSQETVEPVVESYESADGGAIEYVSFAANLDFASKYVFRGVTVNDEPVFQPSASIGFGDDNIGRLSAGIWGNMDLGDEFENEGEFTEVDYIVDYSHAIDIVGFSIGYIYYDFPNTDLDPTQEVYAGLSLDTILQPSLTAYYDFDLADGVYLNGGIGHSIELSDAATMDLGLNIGWMDDDQAAFYYGTDSGFSDVNASVGFGYGFTDNVSGSFSLVYTSVVDGDMRDAIEDPDNLTAFAGIGFEF